jgi:hypothetical protein
LRGGGEGRGRGGGGGARAVLNTSDGLQETARDHVLAGGPLTSAPRAMPSKMQGRTAILLVLWQGIPCRRRGSNPASFIPLIQVRVADGDAQQASPGTLNLLGPLPHKVLPHRPSISPTQSPLSISLLALSSFLAPSSLPPNLSCRQPMQRTNAVCPSSPSLSEDSSRRGYFQRPHPSPFPLPTSHSASIALL